MIDLDSAAFETIVLDDEQVPVQFKEFMAAVAGNSVIYRETIGSYRMMVCGLSLLLNNYLFYTDEIAGDIIGCKKVEKLVKWRRRHFEDLLKLDFMMRNGMSWNPSTRGPRAAEGNL